MGSKPKKILEKIGGQLHRGRIQVQGEDMLPSELSWPWSEYSPPLASCALSELSSLQNQCNDQQQKNRKRAFVWAQKFIERAAPSGVSAPVSQSYQDKPPPKSAANARVDIEVRTGLAFVEN